MRNKNILNKSDILILINKNLPYLTKEFNISRIGLFGSYAKENPNDNSDIDIVARFEQPPGLKFIEFTEYLEKLLGQKVDVLTEEGIKGIRNKEIAQSIRNSIIYV
jgi:predicted nucleotidyltransferase